MQAVRPNRLCWLPLFGFAWIAAALAFGSLVWLGVFLSDLFCDVGREVWLVIFGVPWLLLSAMLAHTAYLLVASCSPWGDVEREWLGRASGWYLITALAWLIMAAIVLIGPKLYFEAALIGANGGKWLTTVSAAGGAITAFIGKSGLTPARGSASGWPAITANVVFGIAATVFGVGLLILFSAWLDIAELHFFRHSDDLAADACFSAVAASDIPRACYDTGGWAVLAAALASIAFIANLFVNVNRFSLHAVYRNRLIRAYLGASREPGRAPDAFTGFDWNDNLRVASLWSGKATARGWRPFHVINMTLNLAATRNLAWQQRKAMSFTATPLFCGAAGAGRADSLGYRHTRDYGDPTASGEFRDGREIKGITLGTAMAVSGAAASPNMGYYSSPGAAFLMTLFDVRLGWWLGNPSKAGERTYQRAGPLFALKPILAELFGLTDDTSPYVYLSDGGHFENLGLYEMIRRRCKWIVVVDAGAFSH